jgi:hypothetical protein
MCKYLYHRFVIRINIIKLKLNRIDTMTLVSRRLFVAVCLILTVLAGNDLFSQATEATIIKGRIADAKTGEPIAGANAFLDGTTIGTITDKDGRYRIETPTPSEKITFSFIGYQSESRTISRGKEQTMNVNLKLSLISLDEVKVKARKESYRNKENPAVELIEKVIDRKNANRKEKYDFLEYKQYEKIQFALSNISEKFRQGNMLGKFGIVFNNLDTTKRIGNTVLPLYIKESSSDHYYRKNPEATKEIVRAEKTTDLDKYLDNKGVSAYFGYLYQNINIYDNEILFLTNKFLSPVAKTAPAFYRYYITDTLSVNNIRCIKLFFEPRNKADFLFHGNLYITMDGNYAIRKIDMGVNKNINIDWVRDISITQDFDNSGQKDWLLSKEEISIDFGIMKNAMGLYGQRTISCQDYQINKPVDKSIFTGPEKIERISQASDNSDFGESNRLIPLTKSEKGIYATIDSLKKIPAFNRRMNFITMLTTGFLNLGKIEIGPDESFYSYNTVEGSRLRFGGRTTPDFSKKITLDGYVAYGLTDKISKYYGSLTYSLTPGTIYQFPVKSVRVSYQNDTKIPGQELQFTQADNIFLSFKRGKADQLFLNKTIKAEYLNEFENHFSYLIGYDFTRQSTEGDIRFNTNDYLSLTNDISAINISEFYLNLRYAPNESFYQGKIYRDPMASKYPVFQLNIAGGSKSIRNDYNYLRLQLNINKRFYFSFLGYTDITAEAGKIYGKVPYPLLFIHRANQTYSFQENSYNLMNFLEFVSDQYVSLNVEHCFNGFLFNEVPLIKKLKLREVVACKVLYGGLSKTNNPDYQSDLFKFPVNNSGTPLTNTLSGKPYVESSIGISNIFKVLRIDLVKRFTYVNNPDISKIGVRMQVRLDI